MHYDEWEERMYEEYCDTHNEGNDLNDQQFDQFRLWLNEQHMECVYD